MIAHRLLALDTRLVIAHRGASAEAPENTLRAFRLAERQGADAFELDVRVTADDVPVLLHDPTLDRTTNRSGPVRGLTLAAIREADAGASFPDPGGALASREEGTPIPTLAEVLEAFPTMPLLIEIKDEAAQRPVARTLLEHEAADRVVVASFRDAALDAFRAPPFLVGASRRDILALYLRGRLHSRGPRPECVLFAVPDYWKGWLEVPRPAIIALARRHGRPVHVWTVDDPNRARVLWSRGVSGVITNRPAALVAIREQAA